MATAETQKHIRIVGLIYIIFGCIGLLGSFIAVYFGINDSLRVSNADPEVKILIYIWGAILVLFLISLGYIFVGRAIRAEKRWATRVAGFIVAILMLPSFPVGTAIGIYAIWALNKIIKDEPTTTQIVS